MITHHSFDMKYIFIRSLLVLYIFLMLPAWTIAQQESQPQHRFSVRWNALGLVNLDGIGEVEYAISKRVGLFVGGGSLDPIVNLDRLGWAQYRRADYRGWGLYAGARLPFSIGSFHGLSVKPSIFYSRFRGHDYWIVPFVGPPFFVTYMQNKVGGQLSLAYAKTFLKRFFVEPVVGVGLTYGQPHIKGAGFKYMGLSVPAQLNLGVRF